MKKTNLLLILALCILYANSTFAMLADSEKQEQPYVIIYGDGDVGFSYNHDTTQPGKASYIYALWEKLPNRQAFNAWCIKIKKNPSFIKAKRTLGITLFSGLLYQIWIYAHTQCNSDGTVAHAMCGGANVIDNFGLMLKDLLINFGLGFKIFTEFMVKPDAQMAARLDACLEKATTMDMEHWCWRRHSDIYDNY